MTQQPVSALFDRWAGQPILVIGGGPSVKEDLPALLATGIKPACVIGANDHGPKQPWFPVDLVVNCDKFHCLRKLPMEPIMRAQGIPVVNRHSWADYRLTDWTFAGNTGLTAIALACALGGNPVIVTGIDMWHGGRRYFHDGPMPKTRREVQVSAGVTKHDRARMAPLREFAAGANVRPMSGPLCSVFPKFDPNEVMSYSGQGVAYTRRALRQTYVQRVARKNFSMSSHDPVVPGTVVTVTPAELQRNPRLGSSTTPVAI